jgi:glycosyltransferase involved in cell wall biosynthesis
MNDLPKISIVIPAYNVAAYIAETLESVFAQTF